MQQSDDDSDVSEEEEMDFENNVVDTADGLLEV